MSTRKMTKEEAMAHMKKMFERLPSNELMFHMEVIGHVLADRMATETKDKNIVLDLSHMKVMQ